MSSFKKDLAKEAILGQFLNEHYEKANLKTQRINQIDLQHLGVDLLLEGKNQLSFKVDEKAQLHYLNKNLPTFALEIDYLKDGELKEGWLFDSTKVTEVYAFIFSIHLTDEMDDLTELNDIASCDVIFVNRIRLINELSKHALDFSLCKKQSERLRNDDTLTKIDYSAGFNFQISNHLAEKPVNLIVKKTFLEANGKQYFFKKK